MTTRRNLVIAAAGLAAAGTGTYLLFAGPHPASDELVVVRPIADAGPTDARPPRCAELGRTAVAARSVEVGGRVLDVRGAMLTIGAATATHDGPTIVGVIADAHDASADTVANVQRAARLFATAKVDLVLVLGGMATASADLVRLLRPLTGAVSRPIVLVPGDRESVAATASSVAELGDSVFDGSEVRIIDIDGVRIGTLPGVEFAERAIAGNAGCLRAPEDTDAIVAELAKTQGVTVLASYSPPRQRGLGGTDRAPDGTHIGDIHLSEVLENHAIALVIHAQSASRRDESARGSSNETPTIVAVGAIDAVPRRAGSRTTTGSALIVRIEAGERRTKFTWRRIRFLDGKEQP